MLTLPIEYTDFNDNKQTDVHHFNLTKTELIELESSYEGGLQDRMRAIVETEDMKALVEEFQKLVLLAYGKKSDDGKRFVKSDQLREEFKQTAAYDALFMKLATDENAAHRFIEGIMPKDMPKPDEDKPLPPPPAT